MRRLAVLPVLSAATRLVTLFYLFNYICCVIIPGLNILATMPGIEALKMISNFSLLIAMVASGWLYYYYSTRPTSRR